MTDNQKDNTNPSSKYKLLVVSFSFFPDDSPNTYRWKDIINSWSEKGLDIFVVSAQKKGLSKFEIVNGVKIYRTGRSLFQILKTKLGSKSNGNIVVRDSAKSNSKSLSKESFLRKCYNFFWKGLYWPDWAFLFYSSALKQSREIIKRENITHLITVSWPFTDHLIGYQLKKENDLIWLAEIIDPFSFNEEINNQRIYSGLNNSVERKVLNKADLISVMTQRIRDKYVSLFPEIKDKIHVIHNLYVPDNANSLDIQKSKDSKVLKFVFMGSLSPGVRTPENLLRLFKKLLDSNSLVNPELHFYGKIHSSIKSFYEYENLINKSIFLHGSVSKSEVIDILLDADILINIGNSNPYQEPSKIIEYVYLGKPVINICSIDLDSSKELLDQYPLNFNVHQSEIENENFIKNILAFLSSDFRIERSLIQNITKPYRLEEVQVAYTKLVWKDYLGY